MFIFDRVTVSLGSHNIAHAASASNIDLSVCFTGREAAQPFAQWFDDAWARAK